jgi:hypothetical protein
LGPIIVLGVALLTGNCATTKISAVFLSLCASPFEAKLVAAPRSVAVLHESILFACFQTRSVSFILRITLVTKVEATLRDVAILNF